MPRWETCGAPRTPRRRQNVFYLRRSSSENVSLRHTITIKWVLLHLINKCGLRCWICVSMHVVSHDIKQLVWSTCFVQQKIPWVSVYARSLLLRSGGEGFIFMTHIRKPCYLQKPLQQLEELLSFPQGSFGAPQGAKPIFRLLNFEYGLQLKPIF